jgi:hypothetical protein
LGHLAKEYITAGARFALRYKSDKIRQPEFSAIGISA